MSRVKVGDESSASESLAAARNQHTALASEIGPNRRQDISEALTILLADMFSLYMKTKSFHWHMSGPHFRDYHLLLDEQASQILATTDVIAERVRKLGGTTLRSIGHIGRLQRIADNEDVKLAATAMLVELLSDNRQLLSCLRAAHEQCAGHGDVASTSLIENWIDEAELRTWFLTEAGQRD